MGALAGKLILYQEVVMGDREAFLSGGTGMKSRRAI
jgi:hypothetical protein